MPRSTFTPSRIGTAKRITVNGWEVLLSALVVLLTVAFIITVFHMATEPVARVTVTEGERVCVAMMSPDDEPIPDAYYCGPLTLTTHDDIEGESR